MKPRLNTEMMFGLIDRDKKTGVCPLCKKTVRSVYRRTDKTIYKHSKRVNNINETMYCVQEHKGK